MIERSQPSAQAGGDRGLRRKRWDEKQRYDADEKFGHKRETELQTEKCKINTANFQCSLFSFQREVPFEVFYGVSVGG